MARGTPMGCGPVLGEGISGPPIRRCFGDGVHAVSKQFQNAPGFGAFRRRQEIPTTAIALPTPVLWEVAQAKSPDAVATAGPKLLVMSVIAPRATYPVCGPFDQEQ